MSRGYVLFDVDGTLVDRGGQAIPEALFVINLVRLLDFEVVLWSAAGATHAAGVSYELGLGQVRCFTKPDRPSEDPALVVDNDPGHRIKGQPFLRVVALSA